MSVGDSVFVTLHGSEFDGVVTKKGTKFIHVYVNGSNHTVEIENSRIVSRSGHTVGQCYRSREQYESEINFRNANTKLLSIVNDPDIRLNLGYEKMKKIIEIIEGE